MKVQIKSLLLSQVFGHLKSSRKATSQQGDQSSDIQSLCQPNFGDELADDVGQEDTLGPCFKAQVGEAFGDSIESLVGEDEQALFANDHVFQGLLHRLHKVFYVERLGKIAVGLKSSGFGLDFIRTICCDQNRPCLRRDSPDTFHQLQSIDARHPKVGDDQIKGVGFNLLQSLLSRLRTDHFVVVSQLFQTLLEEKSHFLLVINYQDPLFVISPHYPPPLGGWLDPMSRVSLLVCISGRAIYRDLVISERREESL